MLLLVLREIFPFLAALYLLDGLAWVGALNLLFVHRVWGWSAVEGRGVRLAGILPFDLSFPVAGPVALPLADGVYVPDPAARGAAVYDPERWTRIDYAAPAELEEGTLRLGAHRVRFPSRAHAEGFAELLAELRDLPPEGRERRLARQRTRSFHLDAAQARLDTFREETQLLRVVGWGLFVLAFLLLPAVLYLHPAPERLLAPLVWGIAFLYLAALGTAVHAGSRLRAGQVLRRSASILPLVLSPVSSVHAVAAVGRDLLEGFDPLAAAALLLHREKFLSRARGELHGAAFAASQGGESWRRHWAARRRSLLALLDRFEIGEAEALAAPPRRDASARSWCPVCGIESREEEGTCGECGLPLAGFGP